DRFSSAHLQKGARQRTRRAGQRVASWESSRRVGWRDSVGGTSADSVREAHSDTLVKNRRESWGAGFPIQKREEGGDCLLQIERGWVVEEDVSTIDHHTLNDFVDGVVEGGGALLRVG